MTKCDFKQLCTRYKEPDRLVAVRISHPDEVVDGKPYVNFVKPGVSMRFLGDLKDAGWEVEFVTEPGKDVATYRTCDKGMGHSGRHGYYWYQHPVWFARKLRIRLSNIVIPGGIS